MREVSHPSRPSRTCLPTLELVDAYVDNELADRERVEVEQHIAGCDSCRSVLQHHQRMKSNLRALSQPNRALDSSFHERLQAQLAASHAHRVATPTWRTGLPWALAAAAVFGVLLGGITIVQSQGRPQQTPANESGAIGKVAGVSDVQLPVITQSVAWHRRQVPVEVTGPSPGLVTDWFQSKLAFEVQLPDLQGHANLLGGRLGNIDESQAAVLTYDADGLKLSVLVFDADEVFADSRNALGLQQAVYRDPGHEYTVAVERRGDVGYTFTANLPEADLRSLVRRALLDAP